MVRQGYLIAVVLGALLIGSAGLLGVGCTSRVRPKTPQKEDQEDIEATKEGQEHTEATREQQELYGEPAYDSLKGGVGKDILHGGAGSDFLVGGAGDDVIYGDDNGDLIFGVEGEDVLYGGDGKDYLDGRDEGLKNTQRDELYCGAGKDTAIAGKLDSVSSNCEVEKDPPPTEGRRVRVD